MMDIVDRGVCTTRDLQRITRVLRKNYKSADLAGEYRQRRKNAKVEGGGKIPQIDMYLRVSYFCHFFKLIVCVHIALISLDTSLKSPALIGG